MRKLLDFVMQHPYVVGFFILGAAVAAVLVGAYR